MKDSLQKIVDEMRTAENLAACASGNVDARYTAEWAERIKALMEQEAVAWLVQGFGGPDDQYATTDRSYVDSAIELHGSKITPLFAAPQSCESDCEEVRQMMESYCSLWHEACDSLRELETQSCEKDAILEELAEALRDIQSCMRGVLEGDYQPDSLTLQPVRIALARYDAIVAERTGENYEYES